METIKGWIARLTNRTSTSPTSDATPPTRDFDQERETNRAGQMSADDRAWETESKQRETTNQAAKQTPPRTD
jgi:hypothetical protein